jgi:hypothetical protein
VSDYKEGIDADGRVSEGIGNGNSFHRLQEWFDYSQANSSKEINAEFISNVWRVLDSAGNLLIRKHHDYGPKNISDSPGGALNGLRVRMHDKMARINHLVDSEVSPSNESLRDSFLDLLNYSAIAMMVLDKTWPEITDD